MKLQETEDAEAPAIAAAVGPAGNGTRPIRRNPVFTALSGCRSLAVAFLACVGAVVAGGLGAMTMHPDATPADAVAFLTDPGLWLGAVAAVCWTVVMVAAVTLSVRAAWFLLGPSNPEPFGRPRR